uniref:Uncharacterized protein n=1 Tax=Anguilla anguilla TaxID=7936 RepID=A0A0E9RDM7_ANGAN
MVSHGGSFDLLGTLTDFSEELLDVITVNQRMKIQLLFFKHIHFFPFWIFKKNLFISYAPFTNLLFANKTSK